ETSELPQDLIFFLPPFPLDKRTHDTVDLISQRDPGFSKGHNTTLEIDCIRVTLMRYRNVCLPSQGGHLSFISEKHVSTEKATLIALKEELGANTISS
ncbi:hypothetical protein ILYODFUR_033769, partial [Ilyodon furcidens]